ncbi:MAG: Calx-beta domain-containing protein [Planctomycetota bacterium]
MGNLVQRKRMIPLLVISLLATVQFAAAFPLQVDIGETGQQVKPGWEAFTGTHEAGPLNRTYPVDTGTVTVDIRISNGNVSGYRNYYPGGDVGGDMVYADASDDTGPIDAQVILTLIDLTAGNYSLTAFHNDSKSTHEQFAPIDVQVTGAVSASTSDLNVAQTKNAVNDTGLGQSNVAFTATGSGDVIITYTPTSSGSDGKAVLNGFILEYSGSTITFTADASADPETIGTALIPVTLNNPEPTQTYTVEYEVIDGTAQGGGIDFDLDSGVLTFNPGQTTKTIPIDINDDGADEEDETIVIELSNPTGPDVSLGAVTIHTYTIVDPRPALAYDIAQSNGHESLTPALIDVSLSAPSGDTVTVDYAVAGGSAQGNGVDYTLNNGTLTFLPGQTTRPISIDIIDDDENEYAETIVISLLNPTNAKTGDILEHTYTIQSQMLHLKVDFGLPQCLDGGATVIVDPPVEGTVKDGWWPYVASRWADMYMHDPVWERGENGDGLPPDTDGIAGSGVHVAIGCGGVGNGGFHVYSMCRDNLGGDGCPTGSPTGGAIANGWYHNIDWGGEATGDILMRINALPPGEYELISYHNHWEPCTQATRHCLGCYSEMPNMPSVTAQSLPPGPLPGYGSWNFTPGTGTGVTSIQNAYDVDVTSLTDDELISTSTIIFQTDGSDVLVIYDGGDNTYPDPARSGREGSKAVLNAFEIKLIRPLPPVPCDLYAAEAIESLHLKAFTDNWLWTGWPADNIADFNADGKVNFKDFASLALQWFGPCE